MAASLGSFPSTPPLPTIVDLPPTTSEDVYPPSGFVDDLLRYTPVPTLILDAALLVRQVSDTYLIVSGASNREDLVGRNADDIFSQAVSFSAHASARKALRIAQDTKSVQQLKHLTIDGRAWTVRAVPVIRHGALRYLQMEITDTTEEHRKQLELEERLYTNECFRILGTCIHFSNRPVYPQNIFRTFDCLGAFMSRYIGAFN